MRRGKMNFDPKFYVILRGIVGSTAHGLNNEDAIEDRDEMGICIEPIEQAIGLHPFQQYIYRSAAEREKRHNARSKAGDLDLVIYSLRKYVRLALSGNPTILLLLFIREPLVLTEEGKQLRALAPSIVSKKSGKAFHGYMVAQKRRLLGEQGGKHGAGRPELIEKYGFDTKYAAHIIRLGLQGIEVLETGSLTLPMPARERAECLDVRNGKVAMEAVIRRATQIEQQLEELLTTSHLPNEPDNSKVEEWMVRTYSSHWTT
jgi:predicted nucleotidyltransferase